MKPGPFTHCVFDAYGTLFDVHSAVGRYREVLGEKADPVSILWRTKQLEYTWLRSLMRQHVDFWQITSDALEYAFSAHEIINPELPKPTAPGLPPVGLLPGGSGNPEMAQRSRFWNRDPLQWIPQNACFRGKQLGS